MTRMILAILASLVALLVPTALAGPHDSFKRTSCYCVSGPEPLDFVSEFRRKVYYNAGLNRAFIMDNFCIDDTSPMEDCLPTKPRAETQCVEYPIKSRILDPTARSNKLCYHSMAEWQDILDMNRDAAFAFNGQKRALKLGAKADIEVPADEVQKICDPICKDHFGGVPMRPVGVGGGAFIESYE
ncbi:MAG: hypothetical protein Q9188_006629 [Gyalolechia gomerana]